MSNETTIIKERKVVFPEWLDTFIFDNLSASYCRNPKTWSLNGIKANIKNNTYMKKDWMIKESELDDDQIKVLMETLNNSCIIEGCAGSGKSVLALIKAKRIQKEFGNDYKVIVFTKALCGYMNTGKEELGLTNDFYYYKEWKFQREMRGGYIVYSRDENDNMIPYMPSADYIIVDEIQDFSKQEVENL